MNIVMNLPRTIFAVTTRCTNLALLRAARSDLLQNQIRNRTKWAKLKARFSPKVPTFDYSGDKTLELPNFEDGDSIFTIFGIDPSEVDVANKETYAIQNADHCDQIELLKCRMMERFGRYDGDDSSPEVKVALLTVRIRNQIRHMQQFPKDKITKGKLIENIHRRRKKLAALQSYDIDRFNWVCDELQLTYIPVEESSKRILPRRSRLRTAAIHEMMEMKESKLEQLKQQLAVEREEYYNKKEEIMKEIREQEDLLAKETEILRSTQVKTGYPGDNGEFAFRLAHIKPINREKWWRKHPDVLRMRYGNKARIPKTV